ncbi:MAG: DUF2828 family protein [Clostridiales bacterium]|nr:DUF2828 family protein [Clostridiales bacterium]
MKNLISVANEEYNVSQTENGAVGYRTTGRALLDLNFAVSSLRNMSAAEVVRRFSCAFYEDKLLATKWLFFVCDVRGGCGERRLFRLCMYALAGSEPKLAKALLPLIPEYSRWDNLVLLLDTALCDDVVQIIKAQLDKDIKNKSKGKQVSLLAKWLPSINATSAETRALAKLLITKLGMTAKQYRQTLSALRKYIDVTEVKMSAGAWKDIAYDKVPSKANLLYGKAFLRHDEKRRNKYLEALKRGETKINASTLFPHDIVHKYTDAWQLAPYDETVEQLWKALPDYVQGDGTTLCVADGSGSMTARVGNTNVTALEIANALAIYFAERCKGQFKDTFITFSENPQIVSFAHCNNMHDKLGVVLSHDEVANTNIEAVFDLILTTAVKHKMKQSELPANVLILSDMEFDMCAVSNAHNIAKPIRDRLFEEIGARYEAKGYKLPRLIFWNICSRTLTVPLTTNKLGVALVSGFSPAVLDMVLSGDLDPYKCLIAQINDQRYDAVEKAFKNAQE